MSGKNQFFPFPAAAAAAVAAVTFEGVGAICESGIVPAVCAKNGGKEEEEETPNRHGGGS